MDTINAMSLLSSIARQISGHSVSRLIVAYSGGVDSHVLLHLCALDAQLKNKLTAVYVHHGLQPQAEVWAQHCQYTAHALSVDFKMLRVNAMPQLGESPEEAARNARYTALKDLIEPNCALLVAQHREDQLETVLLQLFRGGGLRGLSGMPESMAFGLGVMLRPLLNAAKQDIMDYAHTHKLRWIEDPSNAHSDYDRNFLRNDIVPLLKQRWPALDKTVSRSAAHCASAENMLGHIAQTWFLTVFNTDDNTLSLQRLLTFETAQHAHIIRAWFQHLGLKMPAQGFVTRILVEVVGARQDSEPLLTGQGVSIRRYRDKLYCLKQTQPAVLVDMRWPKGAVSVFMANKQRLSCVPTANGLAEEKWLNATVVIKFRGGGEKIALSKREGRHALKNLFQEAGIPPWQRAAIPLVYLDDKLAAVGDKWISAEFYTENEAALRLVLQIQD